MSSEGLGVPRDRSPVRVLLVSVTPFFGGGEVYFSRLAKLLTARYEVAAIAANDKLVEDLRSYSIPVWSVYSSGSSRISRYVSATRALFKACSAFKPHIIHFNGQGEAYLAQVARFLHTPITMTRHTLLDSEPSLLKQRLAAINYKRADAAVCVSSQIKAQLANRFNPAALTVIPNWVAADSIAPVARVFRTVPSPFRLLFVGRLVALKGILDLIAALHLLKEVSLDVVGDGELLQELRSRSPDLPVTFHGFQSDCSSFYRNADLLVFPSHFEGQGLVPIEAMAVGLPCLVSDIPAVKETVGEAAAIFRCGDPADLAKQIEGLLNNPDRLSFLSRSGIHRVKTTYTEDAIRRKYFDFFDGVAGNSPHSKRETPIPERETCRIQPT